MIKAALNLSSRQRGFTLVEISIVLIVIGLIVGAVSIGKDLQRNATYQQLNSVFIQSWVSAYQNYYSRVGIVIGDDPVSPSGRVNDGGGLICEAELVQEMQRAGVATPTGRGNGNETRFAYLDSNGNPQQAEICFDNRDWSVPDGEGAFMLRQRNVMVVYGLTPDLARHLDSQIDGRSDARFGQFREAGESDNIGGNSLEWSADNLPTAGTGNLGEAQVNRIGGAGESAHYLMNP